MKRMIATLTMCGLILGAGASTAQNVPDTQQYGAFSGPIITKWLEHTGPDRNMLIVDPITFQDKDGTKWHVPKDAIIDGASIPRVFWTFFGPPFVGDYRRASVIHDYFCDTKSKPWEKVHRMFYLAARAGGVSHRKAKSMYAAIRKWGRKWITTVGFDGQVQTVPIPTPRASEKELAALVRWIDSKEPTLDEIDEYVDRDSRKP